MHTMSEALSQNIATIKVGLGWQIICLNKQMNTYKPMISLFLSVGILSDFSPYVNGIVLTTDEPNYNIEHTEFMKVQNVHCQIM